MNRPKRNGEGRPALKIRHVYPLMLLFWKARKSLSCTCKFLSEAPLNSLRYSTKARISRCSLHRYSGKKFFSLKRILKDRNKQNNFSQNYWQITSKFLVKEMLLLTFSLFFFLYVKNIQLRFSNYGNISSYYQPIDYFYIRAR